MKKSRWISKKKFLVMTFACSLVFFGMGILFSLSLAADEPFPSRPISIVISMPPGGGLDIHAKIIGDRLSEVLGQPVLRVHKPGGGGVLGAEFAARAKPDGYTLFTGTSSNFILPPILKKMDYTWEDFIPLGIYCKGVVRLYVKKDAPWKTLQEFIQEGKKRSMKVGSYGKNSHPDLVIGVLAKQAGIKLVHIPYKGCAAALTALLGGHIDGDFCPTSMGQAAAGEVRVLAIADIERSKIQPDVKTFQELGYPISLPLLYSITAPKKTPPRIVNILANGIQEVYGRYEKEIQEQLIRAEFVPSFFTMEKSIELFRQDYETTSRIAKELGMVGQ